jgi:hypothetical protein
MNQRTARWELALMVAAGGAMVALLVVPACTDDGTGGDGRNWTQDARCASLCDDSTCPDPATKQACLDTCSIGLHATATTCSACMLDNACASGCTLEFSATNCSNDCMDVEPVVPGDDDPRCDLICNAENGCATAAQLEQCDSACDAAVRGASGPCGSCLLDNVCASSCDFRQTDASECAALCD